MQKNPEKRHKFGGYFKYRPRDVESKKIRTHEDWWPNYSDGTVLAALSLLHDGMWRVSVWGDDDFGLEKDFPHTERQQAKKLFAKIEDFITQEQLKEWGLVNA